MYDKNISISLCYFWYIVYVNQLLDFLHVLAAIMTILMLIYFYYQYLYMSSCQVLRPLCGKKGRKTGKKQNNLDSSFRFLKIFFYIIVSLKSAHDSWRAF